MHNFGGGRSDLFNLRGWLKGGVKKFRGAGVWTLDETMILQFEHF